MIRHFLKIIFLVFLLKAPVVWGFSYLQVQKYIQKSYDLKLAKDTQWIRLGHYEKTVWGYQSHIQGPFFINSNGASDPQAELESSIVKLFSPETSQLQCKYLARTKWLVKELKVDPKDIMACPDREAWKKQLHIESASLIFASADMGNAASAYGHTFLKFTNPENQNQKQLLDYVVNYAAAASSEDFMYALKGLTGFYRGYFSMEPYHQKIREYINLEGRDIWEYELNLTADEVDFLIDHLLELEGSYRAYYFLNDNCSYQLLTLLEVVRPSLRLKEQFHYFTIPLDTIKVAVENGSLVRARHFRKSLKNDYKESYANLNLEQRRDLKETLKNHSETSRLKPLQKAEVIETAMKYYAIQSYKSESNYESEKYSLARQRAALGMLTSENAHHNLLPPDESTDSSAVYLGGGALYSQPFGSFKFRNAYHDLVSNDEGLIPYSQNEMLNFEVHDYYQTARWELYNLTLIDLLSTEAVTPLDTPLSWKMSAGTEYDLRPKLEAGAGYSFDYPIFKRSRFVYFLSGRIQEENYDNIYHFFVGPEVIWAGRIIEPIGFAVFVRYFGQWQSAPIFERELQLSYEIKRDLEIQTVFDWDQIGQTWKLQLVDSFIL